MNEPTNDPGHDPMKQAWHDVEEGFSALGRMMKQRYQSAEETEAVDEAHAPDGAGESGAALRDAFDRLVAAGREFGERTADVARDDEVKAQAKQAAASLNSALSATVDLIGHEVGGLFKRSGDTSQAAEADEAPEPPEIDPPPR